MASNALPKQLDRLFALAEDMADGLAAHEAPVGIRQNTEGNMRADLAAAQAAENTFQTRRAAKSAAVTAQTVADSNAKAFIGAAKNVLEVHLGRRWSNAWASAGFVDNTTALPRTLGERLSCLDALSRYFTANPGQENAPLNLTASRATTLFNNLGDARAAVNEAQNEAGAAKAARNAAVEALRTRMNGLIAELTQLLGAEDPRWYAFGLNRPADTDLPEVPENLVLTAGPVGTVLVDWADARRAERYRVFRQVVGSDADFVPAATVVESETTLSGLPSGATVKVRVSAANDAGESRPGAEAQIVVP